MGRKKFTKAAFILSVCMLILWAVLGAGTTLAWFTDTTPVDKNSFLIGNLELKVSYKNDVQTVYAPMTTGAAIFNDNALYEPGYTQVVYLKVENTGDLAFDYKMSIDIRSYVDSISSTGLHLHLPDYLKFGVIFGGSEAELDREVAQFYGNKKLQELEENTYSPKDVTVPVGGTRYVALIVYMPEEVANEANFRDVQPMVRLGITLLAQQAGAPLE